MKIVIVGGGKVGFAIAREVSAEGHDVTIIDSSRAVCDRLSLALDGMTVQGNGAALDVQHAALVPDSDLLIAVSPNDEANILACMLARKIGCANTIARIRSRAQAAAPAAPAAPVLPEGQGPEKSKYVREALTYLSEHYNDPDISVSSVARSLGVSDGHLSHVFKKETSYTLSAYLTNYRMHKATELLRDCRVKVYEVAESVGYRDITYFSSAFKKSVGMSPSEYQKRCQ